MRGIAAKRGDRRRPPIFRSTLTRDYILLVALAGIWASAFAFIKIGVETVPPLTLATGRILIATAFLFVCIGLARETIPRSGRLWGVLFLVGILGNGLPFTLIAWGEQAIDSGLAAILMAIVPLATLVLVHVFTLDERMTVPKVAGVVVGFAGVIVLIGPDALAHLGGSLWHQLAVAAGALCYAVAATLTRRLPPTSPLVASAVCMLLSSLQMLPFALVVDQPWSLSPSFESMAAVVYLGLFPTGLTALIYFHLIAARGATFLVLNNYIVPALGVIYGVLLLDERLGVEAYLALALILLGVAIAGYRRRSTGRNPLP